MSRLIRKLVLFTGVVLAAVVISPPEAGAQSDILLRLRSGSPLGDRVRVDSAGGVVAMGTLGIGIIPATGAGERMMWFPFKGAFRAGSVPSAGTQWDDANIGFYSAAFGHATIAKGIYSLAAGEASNASGQGSVALGYRATADADYAVALGHRASANGHPGSFNAADQSTTDSLQASANNQFNARYAGGYRLFTNSTMTVGLQMLAGASSWTVISDKTKKTAITPVNHEDILRRIRSIPVATWRFKDAEAGRYVHIGPMAQDFQKAFPLEGAEQTSINMSDLDGVNLAGVRALEARTRKMQSELDAKSRKIESLEARLAKLEALLAQK